MSVKLSTSRLRTAPGMGERTGCYRCGQEGHWSKECPMDQNGSYREGPGSAGYGPLRFGEGGERGGRGFHRGYSGEPAFGGNFSHGFSRGAGYGVPGYGRGAGFENAVSYGMPAGYSIGADNSMAPAYGSEAAYGSSGVAYGGAMPAYQCGDRPMRKEIRTGWWTSTRNIGHVRTEQVISKIDARFHLLSLLPHPPRRS